MGAKGMVFECEHMNRHHMECVLHYCRGIFRWKPYNMNALTQNLEGRRASDWNEGHASG